MGRGACTLDPLSPMATQKGWIRVAAAYANYQKSLGCGMCLEITGMGSGSGNDPIVGKRKAVIVDLCAGGCGNSKNEFIASSNRPFPSFLLPLFWCVTIEMKINLGIKFIFIGKVAHQDSF